MVDDVANVVRLEGTAGCGTKAWDGLARRITKRTAEIMFIAEEDGTPVASRRRTSDAQRHNDDEGGVAGCLLGWLPRSRSSPCSSGFWTASNCASAWKTVSTRSRNQYE